MLAGTVFGAYADCYDLIYREKDYSAEADKVQVALHKQGILQGSILELGCGTGQHAMLLADKGFSIHGVDLSDDMLDRAKARLAQHPDMDGQIEFSQGDVRTVKLGHCFDAVTSLFHVVCYQTTEQALAETFLTAADHLEKGGVFLFDLWYGPAVRRSPPELRVKRAADESLSVVRIAEPEHLERLNIVKVHYQVFSKYSVDQNWSMFEETHTVRYLFDKEIRFSLDATGFDVIGIFDWATDQLANDQSWNAYCIARLR